MSKRLLIIDNCNDFTGAFKAVRQEAILLQSYYQIIFVIPSSSLNEKLLLENGFTVHKIPFREVNRSVINNLLYFPTLLVNLFRLQVIIKKESIDFIQVNDFYNLLGAMVKLFGFKGRLITYVRFLPSSRPGVLRRIWTLIAQKFSSKVIAVSDAVLAELPLKKNTIRIYDPVSFEEKYSRHLTDKENTGVVKFLYLSNYTRGKGQQYALEAFYKAWTIRPFIRLVFYGGHLKLQKNIHYKLELIDWARRNGLEGVVYFQDFATDIEMIIKDSDVLLNFSDAESFSMTCAEASYYGRPVIATRCGGPEEIINDGKTGFLVKKGNIQEMSEKMIELADDKNLRIAMGERGSLYVRSKFTVSEFVEQFRGILN